jgi:hypothetical protein
MSEGQTLATNISPPIFIVLRFQLSAAVDELIALSLRRPSHGRRRQSLRRFTATPAAAAADC